MVVVTEEFVELAHRMAAHHQRPSLRLLVLPYPLEARPDDELRAIAEEFYPQVLELLGATR